MTPSKTKITEEFVIAGAAGEEYAIQEHTRYTTTTVGGKKSEVLGRAYLLTADGRGVLKANGQNAYSIPSLGLQSLRRLNTAS